MHTAEMVKCVIKTCKKAVYHQKNQQKKEVFVNFMRQNNNNPLIGNVLNEDHKSLVHNQILKATNVSSLSYYLYGCLLVL
jgi:hypothetical protein